VVLTGAGVSAASGIPTFRGPEGIWTVGSREYQPEEMATQAMFGARPEESWSWYLYRLGICRGARPNPAHRAVVDLETLFGDRFRLVTQNVDGLHRSAGSSAERTYEIHGNIRAMRCSAECRPDLVEIPPEIGDRGRGEGLDEDDRERLTCCGCGGWMRPHVLWFDECYDEVRYRFESTLRAAAAADLLVVAGTSGATNLPMQVGAIALDRGALILDINPELNPFREMADASSRGAGLVGSAASILPELARVLTRLAS
jgi:NAD-dependent deacetylase